MGILDWLTYTDWVPFGPSPISAPGVGLGLADGRVSATAPHPTDADTMYIGGSDGGIWKTGVWTGTPPIWLVLGDNQESLQIGGYHAIAVHPVKTQQVFAVASGHGAGVLASKNGGLSWKLLGNALFEGASMGSLALDPTDSNVLYATVWSGGPGGVYKSIDGGQNWNNTTSFHSGGVSDVIVARFDHQTLYAGLIGGVTAGVYRSTDGAATWSLMSPLPSGALMGCAIRLDSALTKGVVYAAYFSGCGATALIRRVKTADGGQTWKLLASSPGSVETRSWHLLLGVDPKNDQHVFVNDAYSIYESTDGGSTWTRADVSGGKIIGDDYADINFDAKDNVVVAADRTLYRYTPKDKSWQSKEGNLQLTQFYDITPDPIDPDIVYGVAQDHTAAMKFTGSVEWAYMEGAGGETGKVLVDPANTSRLYVSNPLDPTHFVMRSTDAGQTWVIVFITTDFAKGDYNLAYAVQKSFAIDPTNPKRLLIGTTKVFETKDATILHPVWTAISGVLGGSANAGLQYITALAIAPSDPKTIYVATGDGHVWVTTDGGATWPAVDTGLFGMGGGKIVDIRIDPKNSQRAFAVGSGKGSVWQLDNVGGSLKWTNISGDLPTYLRFVSILAMWSFGGFGPPALYLGTTRNVYHSVNLGVHWEVFGADMPNAVISDLQSTTPGVLVAAANGRGAWAILVKTSSITGKITQALEPGIVHPGDPVEGVVVVLDPGGIASQHALTAVTDARGQYAFRDVPPGTYTVRRLAPPGYAATGGAPERITVNGSAVSNLDFQYRFHSELASTGAPYTSAADLIVLPGKQAGEAIGAKDEEDQNRRLG